MKKRIAVILLALSFSLSVLSGCSSKGEADTSTSAATDTSTSAVTDTSTSTASDTTTPEENNEETVSNSNEGGRTKYDPVITITAAKQLDENAGRYDPGDDINNNPMISLGVEKLGIKIEYTLLGGDSSNYNTKLRLALTGSETLPDVIPVYDAQIIADLIESQQVKAIDEDIEKYMPQRLKDIYAQYPQTFYPVTKDGKTYGFQISPGWDEGQVMIMRQDWLDNLGLSAPTNITEFESVIKAFTEDDPDGNGKKDTFGFTYAGNDIYSTGWVSDPVMIFSAFTGKLIPGMWQLDANGDLAYGSIAEGNKQALEKMAEWHKAGYLYQEAAAKGAWDAFAPFTESKAGIFVGRSWAMGSVADVTTVAPEAVIKAYPTIRQDNGEPTYQSGPIGDGWFMFSADFDNMEAFLQYYDWLYDNPFGTGDFQYGYIEGYDYDIVDGEVVFDVKLFDPPMEDRFQPSKAIITKNVPWIDRMKPFYDIVNGKEPEAGLEFKAAATLITDERYARGVAIAYEHRDEMVTNLYNTIPTATMSQKWDNLRTLEKQMYTKIIYGELPVSEFDNFVSQWKSSGGDQITAEVNEWYRSVTSN